MLSRRKGNHYKKLVKTPIRIDPPHGEAAWSLSGQGYYRNHQGMLVKISDPIPEDYRATALLARDKQVEQVNT